MKIRNKQLKSSLFILILAVVLMNDFRPVFANEVHVAVVPFTINAEKKLEFLKTGIVEILESRFSALGQVQISDLATSRKDIIYREGPMDGEKARGIGIQVQADFVVYGSLTILGNSASMDAKVVQVSATHRPLSFFRQTDSMDEIIPAAGSIAEEINEKVFRKRINEAAGSFAVQGSEKNRKTKDKEKNEISSIWKRHDVEIQIVGMACGDIDGDGNTEIAVASIHDIYIYQLNEGRLLKTGVFKGKKYHKYLAIDVSDINKNGKPEIFVTSENTGSGSLESFVIEWKDNNFYPIAQDENWYFRIFEKEKGQQLLGQKKGISEPFMPGIFELSWSNSTYKKGKRVNLPDDITVFGISAGDIYRNRNEMLTAFDSKDKLCVFNSDGTLVWKSSDLYGGSEAFIEPFSELGKKSGRRSYLPQRILSSESSGKPLLITVVNNSVSGRVFKRFRSFGSARLVSLWWNGMGLSVIQKSDQLSGYVSDFSIADLNNDGAQEIICAIITQRRGVFSSPKSTIAVIRLSNFATQVP